MKKYKLLDLFCGAGGAGMGYHRAGFEVVGVDINPQKRYPFEFHQADAMTYPLEGFDVIHASPPCQAYCKLRKRWPNRIYPDLIAEIRKRLVQFSKPYIVENVEGAPLINPLLLCGTMFNLVAAGMELRRHRLFEIQPSMTFEIPPHSHDHNMPSLAVYGHSGGIRCKRGETPRSKVADRKKAMGIDWMTCAELSQAIPPAYTEWIGKQIIEYMEGKAE